MLFFIQSFLAEPSTWMVQLDLGIFLNQCVSQDFRSQISRKLSHWVQEYFQGELGLGKDWERIVKERGHSEDESLIRVLERLWGNVESDPTPTRLHQRLMTYAPGGGNYQHLSLGGRRVQELER